MAMTWQPERPNPEQTETLERLYLEETGIRTRYMSDQDCDRVARILHAAEEREEEEAGAAVGPEPVSYVTGLPVVVTVHPEGFVVFGLDLSEASDTRDASKPDDMTDEQLAALSPIVDRAIRRGLFDIRRD